VNKCQQLHALAFLQWRARYATLGVAHGSACEHHEAELLKMIKIRADRIVQDYAVEKDLMYMQ